MEPLVRTGVSQYINLNVAEQLSMYHGPIRLIRRSQDEMISTDPALISTNRGNDLLGKVLRHRYPYLFNDSSSSKLLEEYLSANEVTRNELLATIKEESIQSIVASSIEEWDGRYPCKLGKDVEPQGKQQLILFLASKYMVDFDSTHCTPLPTRYFNLPWDPLRNGDDSFVKI